MERICIEIDEHIKKELEELVDTMNGKGEKLTLEEFSKLLLTFIALYRPLVEMMLNDIYITGVTSSTGFPRPSHPRAGVDG